MLSNLRSADFLLLLLISQTTQAGPVRRAVGIFPRDWNSTTSPLTSSTASDSARGVSTSSSVNPVAKQEEHNDPTPSPIFITLDDSTRSPPAATQTGSQSPSTPPAESTSESQDPGPTSSDPVFLPPPLSTISIPTTSTSGPAGGDSSGSTGVAATPSATLSNFPPPPKLTSGLRNESSTLPADPVSTNTLPVPEETSASSVTSQMPSLQSSLSFDFPVPGATTIAVTTAIVTEQPVASSTSTANVEAPVPQPSPDTPQVSTPPPSFQTTPSSPAAPQITGSPNTEVPTIRSSTPIATATVSPDVAAANLASAKTFMALFATLTEQSACAAGQVACIKGNIGICDSAGAFAMQNCDAGTSCFALPMNTTEGVIVGCYDPTVASAILGTPPPPPPPPASDSSTSAASQAPSSSEIVSEVTTTVTPIIIATSTVIVSKPPPAPIATATSTVLVEPSSAATSPPPGFTTTVIVTRTVDPDIDTTTTDGEQEPTTLTISSSRRRTSTSASASITTTLTDTLVLSPIPSDVPTVPVAKTTGLPSVLTVFVTVTQRERETVTVTQKERETVVLTVTAPS